MEKLYVLTDIDDLKIMGGLVAKTFLYGKEDKVLIDQLIKENVDYEVEKVVLGELFKAENPKKIVLLPRFKAYQQAVKEKFPQAEVKLMEESKWS